MEKRQRIKELLGNQKPYTPDELRNVKASPRVQAINKRFATAKEREVEVERILKKTP